MRNFEAAIDAENVASIIESVIIKNADVLTAVTAISMTATAAFVFDCRSSDFRLH
jgi:hypothetical protein